MKGILINIKVNYYFSFFLKLLTSGSWFINVLNDGQVSFILRTIIGQKSNGKVCLKECNGQGTCDDGICQCFSQFSGEDCSQSKFFFTYKINLFVFITSNTLTDHLPMWYIYGGTGWPTPIKVKLT